MRGRRCWQRGTKCQSVQGLWARVRATATHLNSTSSGADVISISEAVFCCVGDRWRLGRTDRMETSSQASRDTEGCPGCCFGGQLQSDLSGVLWDACSKSGMGGLIH